MPEDQRRLFSLLIEVYMRITFSHNEEVHQILLKFNQGIELNAKENERLDKWLSREERRWKYFVTLKELINMESELTTGSGDDKFDAILEGIKNDTPDFYAKFPKDIKIIARASLIFSIEEDRKKIISRIAYGNRLVRTIEVIVRVIVIVAMILIVLSCLSQ